MCGILHIKRFDGQPANYLVKKTYFDQKDRGTEGYGFVALDTMSYERRKWEHEIMSALLKHKSSEILFHHRAPTSTFNTPGTAHPIAAIDSPLYEHNYYMAHNGMISNYLSLQKEHEKLGIKYATMELQDKQLVFNDSECLLHELALYIEGLKKKEEFAASGSMAFVLLQTDKSGLKKKLFFGRNSSPLIVTSTPNYMILSSEGKGSLIKQDVLYSLDYDTNKIEKDEVHFPLYSTGNSGKSSTNTNAGFNGRHSDINGIDIYDVERPWNNIDEYGDDDYANNAPISPKEVTSGEVNMDEHIVKQVIDDVALLAGSDLNDYTLAELRAIVPVLAGDRDHLVVLWRGVEDSKEKFKLHTQIKVIDAEIRRIHRELQRRGAKTFLA